MEIPLNYIYKDLPRDLILVKEKYAIIPQQIQTIFQEIIKKSDYGLSCIGFYNTNLSDACLIEI